MTRKPSISKKTLILTGLFLLLTVAQAGDAMVSYRSSSGNGNSYPKVRFWNSSGIGTWGSEVELPDSGAAVRHAIGRQCTISTKIVVITQSQDGYIDAYVCMADCHVAGNWEVTNNIAQIAGGGVTDRRFDLQFESQSGDLVLVYAPYDTNTSKDLAYLVLPIASTNFLGITPTYVDDAGHATDIQYMWIRADKNRSSTSQELVYVAMDGDSDHINAWVWDGDSLGNFAEISSDAGQTAGDEALAARYALDSSLAMAVGANGSAGGVNYRYWDGSSWSSVGSFDISGTSGSQNGADLRWASLKADPSSDDLQLVGVDSSTDLNTAYWNGSSWSVTPNIDTAIDFASTRVADFEWELTGSQGRLVWDTDGQPGSTLSQMLCAPECNGTISTISSYAGAGDFLTLLRNPNGTESTKILGIRLNSANDIGSFRFNGTDYTNYGDSVITSDGQTGFEIESIDYQVSTTEPIIDCPVINESGTYAIFKNLEGAPHNASPLSDSVCVKIVASNVDFTCNGFNITNNGTGGTTYGILVNGSLSNVTIRNCPTVAHYTNGIYLYDSSDVNVSNSTVINNSVGFTLDQSDDSSLSLGIAHNNTLGVYVYNSDNASLSAEHFYDNFIDFRVNNTGITRTLNMSGLVFDNPSSNYLNYTNISLNDSLAADSGYSISWSTIPAALPANHVSFRNKYLNLTSESGSVSLETAVWHWRNNDTVGYNESNFELWEYNLSGWFNASAALDAGANTLTIASYAANGVLAILEAVPDTLPPNLSIQSPTNSTYSTSSVDLNYTVTDTSLDSCWYYLDGSGPFSLNCTNLTLGPLSDGPHNVTIFANDSASNNNSSTVYFTVDVPSPADDNDDNKEWMELSYEVICPEGTIEFEVTSHHSPVKNAEIRLIYDTPPVFNMLAVITTDVAGEASASMGANGTYRVRASKNNYHNVEIFLNFEGCAEEPECLSDDDCGSLEQCTSGTCTIVPCDCGRIADHECIEYECCSDEDCPEGSSCQQNSCVELYECASDSDCENYEYCDMEQGAEGGSCMDLTGECGHAQNHLWLQYECGDELGCPACPAGSVCSNNVCISYGISCPESGMLGTEVLCNTTKGERPCLFCNLEITKPDGTILSVQTDKNGQFSLLLDQEGNYDVTLKDGNLPVRSIVLLSMPAGKPPEEQPMEISSELCLASILLLLVLLLLLLWWRKRQDVYVEIVTEAPAVNKPVQMRVLGKKKGKPVRDVLVSVYLKQELVASGKTDKYGRFSFRPASQGSYKLHLMNKKAADATIQL